MDPSQLEILGLDESLRQADLLSATPRERKRARRRLEVAHEIMTALPTPEDLAFMHAGLCQTHLPRSRPKSNRAAWIRQSGRFKLVIQPGLIVRDGSSSKIAASVDDESLYCGVPYGTRARLLLIWLQSEGIKSRIIRMDTSMSAWMRSLGLAVTGGANGTIRAIREQTSRIATSNFSFQWTQRDEAGNLSEHIQNARIVDGMDLWHATGDSSNWKTTIQITDEFHRHLREHAVPLDQRAIAHLAGHSLALDLYAFFAHRLHRVTSPTLLSWATLASQFGDEGATMYRTCQRLRECLPEVRAVYPDMRVDVDKGGIVLRNSPPPVPKKTYIQGAKLRLINE